MMIKFLVHAAMPSLIEGVILRKVVKLLYRFPGVDESLRGLLLLSTTWQFTCIILSQLAVYRPFWLRRSKRTADQLFCVCDIDIKMRVQWASASVTCRFQQYRQCTYNVALRCVRVIIVAVEKQQCLRCVFFSSLQCQQYKDNECLHTDTFIDNFIFLATLRLA
jgi:hypothetical protein